MSLERLFELRDETEERTDLLVRGIASRKDPVPDPTLGFKPIITVRSVRLCGDAVEPFDRFKERITVRTYAWRVAHLDRVLDTLDDREDDRYGMAQIERSLLRPGLDRDDKVTEVEIAHAQSV